MEISIGYFLIGLPICFGIGYIIGVIRNNPLKEEEEEKERGITITRKADTKQCCGYRGGRRCERMTSIYSISGLCNSCSDARFGY
jgi:hypothetical protein